MKIKVFLLFLTACLSLASCEKDKKGLDPNAKINVTGVRSLTKADAGDIPAGGIDGTGITDSLEFITKYAWECCKTASNGLTPRRSFGLDDDTYYLLRDLENNKLKFWGSDAVSSDGLSLGEVVTDYMDIVVTVAKWPDGTVIMPLGFRVSAEDYEKVTFDTVAYIPNSVVLEARAKITAAFNDGDFDTCYKLFDEAYVFLPTTGAKWRALKQTGIE